MSRRAPRSRPCTVGLVSCLVLWLVAGACRGRTTGHQVRSDEGDRPSVILIVVDTLRADHLGTYGYSRDVSPRLDELAQRATVFETACSQAPHTIPSMLQIMSSRYRQGKKLATDTPTLAEILSAGGYGTAAVVENALFEFTRDAGGLMRGFDTFYRNGLLSPDEVFQQHWKTPTPADVVTSQARRWVHAHKEATPFFLWLHYFDPHDPYLPPYSEDMETLSWGSDSRLTGDIRATDLFPKKAVVPPPVDEADRRHLVDLYDAEIRYLDQALGELFEVLEREQLFDKSLIIVAADHGESLGEHGQWTHGTSLFDQQIHVPLIVKYPGQRTGRRVSRPVETLDIVPTVLEVSGVASKATFDGQSLTVPDTRGAAFVFWKDEWVVRTEEWKLLHREGEPHLYRISEDPGESTDLSAERPEVVRALLRARTARLAQIDVTEGALEGTAANALEEMRSLGYLN